MTDALRPIDYAGHVPENTGTIPHFSDDPITDLRCVMAYWQGRLEAQIEALGRDMRRAGYMPPDE